MPFAWVELDDVRFRWLAGLLTSHFAFLGDFIRDGSSGPAEG